MFSTYLGMFGFGLLLLGSWAGWGAALRALLFRRIPVGRALQAGWGLSLALAVGGLLNLAKAITPLAVFAFTGGGLALLIADALRQRGRLAAWARSLVPRGRSGWMLAAAGSAVCALLIVLYAASVRTTIFNFHDDLQGYVVFPTKMVQTGALGADPYSERRILTVGGLSFLQACILSVADVRYLGIIDPGLGVLLSAALLWEIARAARTHPWARYACLLLFLLIPPAQINTTSVLTGLALFLTLFLTLYHIPLRRPRLVRAAVPVALAAAGLCSLKPTLLPAAALLVVGACVPTSALVPRAWATAAGRLAVVGGLALVFFAPWMVSSYASGGTPLYPFLGRGFHGSAYGGIWGPAAGMTVGRVVPLLFATLIDRKVLPLVLLAALPFLRPDSARRRGVLVSWVVATIIACLAMAVAATQLVRYRYSFPYLHAAMFTLLPFAFPSRTASGARPKARAVVGVLVIAVLLFAHAWKTNDYLAERFEAIAKAAAMPQDLALRSVGSSTREVPLTPYVESYARMQQAVPRGAVLLTRLSYPFLLDFNRNTVFINDYPGGASPPPGMPFYQGGERLADYLCGQGIAYVAYSYREEAGLPQTTLEARLRIHKDPWLRSQALHTLDFQHNLAELAHTRARLFDDGDVYVLDLRRSADRRPLPCLPPHPPSGS